MKSIKRPFPPSRRGAGWPLLALLGLGILAVGVAWFTFGSSLHGSGKGEPSRYVEAVVGHPSRINPLFAYLNDTDRDLTALIFSGLTRLGQNGEVQPDLAESWEISADGKSVTFHLRSGVVWHEGTPFTAQDVVFTYDLLANGKLQGDPEQAPLWRQVHCSNPDAVTVVCQLPAPFAPFLAYASVGILPKHILEGLDPAALFDNSFNQTPVGTGPFRLAQLDESGAVLKANASYHLGAPLIDEMSFRFFADAASAAASVVLHHADGLLVDPATDQADLEMLASASGLKVYTADRTAYTMLYLNNGSPPLNDKAVRRAIAEALDVDSAIGDVLGEGAVRGTSPMVPGTWAFDSELHAYDHDEGDAKKLLEEAGWKLPEKGDVRRRDNVELRMSLLTDRDPIRGALADRIVRQLAQVGVGAAVVHEDSSSLVKDFLIPRQYQAAIFGWDLGLDPDPYPAWHSSQASGDGRNLADYQSEDADKVMEQARRTWGLEERKRLYYSFQQIFHDDVPSVVLYYPVYSYFVSDRLKGLELGTLFNTGSRFRNVYQWRLEKSAAIRAP